MSSLQVCPLHALHITNFCEPAGVGKFHVPLEVFVVGVTPHFALVDAILHHVPCLVFHVKEEEGSFVVRLRFLPLIDCKTYIAYPWSAACLGSHGQNTLAFNRLRLTLRFCFFSEVAGNSWTATFSDSLRSGTLRSSTLVSQEALREYFFFWHKGTEVAGSSRVSRKTLGSFPHFFSLKNVGKS